MRLSFQDRKPYARNLFSLNNRLQAKCKIEKFDLDKLSNYINDLNNCTFSFSKTEIFISEHKDPVLKNEENANWNVFGLKDPEGWPAQILYFPSKFLSDILPDERDITDELKIQQHRGFSSLGELSNELVGFTIVPASATRVYVVAPIYEKLDKIILTSNGILTAAFLCHESLSTSHQRISVLYYSALCILYGFILYLDNNPASNISCWDIKYCVLFVWSYSFTTTTNRTSCVNTLTCNCLSWHFIDGSLTRPSRPYFLLGRGHEENIIITCHPLVLIWFAII